jgi:signal transduction histidine kinase
MPKFFRNFRIKSIELSKVRNYLLYAVGEIILVVAGILIAVKVGDINEQKKKEQEFKAALKVVEKDLQADITSVNEALEYWRRADSISIKILQDKITKKDIAPALVRVPTKQAYQP